MDELTREKINGSKKGILAEIKGRNSLLVSFGGIMQGLGIPVFEFFKSLDNLDCDKIYMRDFYQAWYQKGVDENISSIEEIRNYLENIIASNKYKNVCFIGNSMGGYAALLFGNLLNINRVICFAPQTFIDTDNRSEHNDTRWTEQLIAVYDNPAKKTEYFDIKDVLKKNQCRTQFTIFYSPQSILDKCHAERLSDIQNVELVAVNEGGHEVVKAIRNSGELHKIIESALLSQ